MKRQRIANSIEQQENPIKRFKPNPTTQPSTEDLPENALNLTQE
jgi:hypothetical protein